MLYQRKFSPTIFKVSGPSSIGKSSIARQTLKIINTSDFLDRAKLSRSLHGDMGSTASSVNSDYADYSHLFMTSQRNDPMKPLAQLHGVHGFLILFPVFPKKNSSLYVNEMPDVCPAGRTAFLGPRKNGSSCEPRNTLAPQPEKIQLCLKAQRLSFSMLANGKIHGNVSICLAPVLNRRISTFL
jgi:hypothetical protein